MDWGDDSGDAIERVVPKLKGHHGNGAHWDVANLVWGSVYWNVNVEIARVLGLDLDIPF